MDIEMNNCNDSQSKIVGLAIHFGWLTITENEKTSYLALEVECSSSRKSGLNPYETALLSH